MAGPVEDDALYDAYAYRVLDAIRRSGSISAAARELGVSQPNITQFVQRLERRLGTALVERTGRTARLTEAGAVFADQAPAVEAAMRTAARRFNELRSDSSNTSPLRVAAVSALITSLIPAFVTRFSEAWPGNQLVVCEADRAECIRLVAEGEVDVALTIEPTGNLAEDARLYPVVLETEEALLALPPTIATSRSRMRLDEVVRLGLPLIGERELASHLKADLEVATRAQRNGWSFGSAPMVAERQPCDQQAFGAARSTETVLALVEAGLGFGVLPATNARMSTMWRRVRFVHLEPILRVRTIATTLIGAHNRHEVAGALQALAEVALESRPTQTRAADRLRRTHLPRSLMTRSRGMADNHHPGYTQTRSSDMTTRTTTRLLRAGAVTAATVIALAGCASPGATEVGPDTGEQISEITVALPGSISSLYVGQEAGILNYYLASVAQEGLVTIDASGAIQPALAEKWEQTDDTTYVYDLRADAEFQDGTPVTADDVVFSLEMAQDPEKSPGLSYYLTDVTSIEKTGDAQVTVKLGAPNAAFAANMSSAGAAFITSKAFWEANEGTVGSSSSLVLGTGPYQVTEFVPDSHVTYERVDTWWGEAPKVEKITVKFIPDESTRLLAAKSGEVDVAFNVPLQQATQWEALDNMRVEYTNDLSYVGLFFNTSMAPFDDPMVREAIAQSVDREGIVESLLRGHGEVATAIMTPESMGGAYTPEEARTKLGEIPQWNFDLDAAKAALAASNHPDGFTAEILAPATGPHLVKAAQSLAENLGKIGITLNVREVPIEEWLASLDSHGIGFMWYFSTLGDPAEIPSYLLGAGNFTTHENPAIVDLLTRSNAETDLKTRIDLLVEVETLRAADVVNVPLWWGQSATAFKNDLGVNDLSAFTFVSTWPAQLYRAGT